MLPLVNKDGIDHFDSNRIAWPEMNQRPTESSILDQQLIPAASRVGPGLRPPPDDSPLELLGRVHPESDREWLGPGELSGSLDVHRVVTGEFEPLPVHSFYGDVLSTGLARLVLADPVGRPVLGLLALLKTRF